MWMEDYAFTRVILYKQHWLFILYKVFTVNFLYFRSCISLNSPSSLPEKSNRVPDFAGRTVRANRHSSKNTQVLGAPNQPAAESERTFPQSGGRATSRQWASSLIFQNECGANGTHIVHHRPWPDSANDKLPSCHRTQAKIGCCIEVSWEVWDRNVTTISHNNSLLKWTNMFKM